ncbi:response regulator [Elusimicrobiota bacterium]
MKKILIVDDNQGVTDPCQRFLKKRGYKVIAVATKTDAKNELTSNDFDLVIVDCTIGLYMGENLLEEIKKEKPNAGIIVISGYFSNERIKDCIDSGAYHCIDKPFEFNEVLNSVIGFFRKQEKK